MLNESGSIIDDGIFIRLAQDHFLINSSSGGTSHVLGWLEEWSQCDWPDLKVLISDVTSQWANFTVAGPRSRELLQKLDTDINLAADMLGHMQAAQGNIEGIPARVHRISFSGELSFEINIPAAYSNRFMRHLLDLGKDFHLTPYGIEALMILRLEKGYLHVGSDTDGETNPDDVGWGQVVKNKPEDFLGKRSLGRPAALETDRRQLVGIVAVDKQQKIQAGAHILPTTASQVPALTQGWVTSAAFSPTLQRHIALAMVRSGRELIGSTVQAYDEGQYYTVKILAPCFFDPANERLAK
jgi:sarcosine oxidase subunit alpha